MRSVLLSKFDGLYLEKCATELNGAKIAYGIVIGQQAEADKLIVVHLAKNSEEDVDVDACVDTSGEDKENVDPLHTHMVRCIDDINAQALSNQWLSAYKMLPGSLTVLGVFVSAVDKSILDERTFKVAKQLLNDINSLLVQGKPSNVTTVESGNDCDYIFLVHSTSAKQTICKSYTHSSNGGSFKGMECRIVEKNFEWCIVDCNYELDEIFPVVDKSDKINIEQHFQKSVDAVRRNLMNSEIFLQNEHVDDTITLEAFVKKKILTGGIGGGGGSHLAAPHQKQQKLVGNQCLHAVIFQPIKRPQNAYANVNNDESKSFRIRPFDGTMHFTGFISSRVHCNPRNLIADVKRFIRDDIVRSLAARIQIYCDALTDPNVSTNNIFFSEPPRRVYFNLPNGSNTASQVQLSDYIFRGEAPTVAVAQAKQVLDVDIDSQHIIDDMETPPDYEMFSTIMSQSTSTQQQTTTAFPNTLLLAGIGGAAFVLLLSIALYFYMQP